MTTRHDEWRRWVMAPVLFLAGAMTAYAAFPDAFNKAPPGWTGKQFKLSQSYPSTLPAAGVHPWTAFDFKNPAQAANYMNAVLAYCLAGNTSTVAENNFADVGHNTVRKWYHAPWLDQPKTKGREFIHGLTKERPSQIGPPPELGPAQTHPHDNWAVGMYNARGGYAIGQVWKDPQHPDPTKAKFPLHTVTCKYLFTTTPVSEAPYLDGTLEWQADITRANGTAARPTVRLLQLDIAVKVPATKSPIGWVFGTFQYEKAASASTNWWDHMVPVGIMWSNDLPKLLANQAPTTVWINNLRGTKLHVGFRGQLLDGPIDNPHASCTACHGFAQVNLVDNPAVKYPPRPSSDTLTPTQIQTYFRDIKSGEAFAANYMSLDYSLQLQLGISNAVNLGGARLPTGIGTATNVTHAAGAHPPEPVTKISSVSREGDEN